MAGLSADQQGWRPLDQQESARERSLREWYKGTRAGARSPPPPPREEPVQGPRAPPAARYPPPATRAPLWGQAQCEVVEEDGADVVFTGLWTCCKRVEPDAPGCVHAQHVSDNLQCGECGLWVPLKAWGREGGCQRHPVAPELLRWGGCRWPCCNDRGFQGTRLADVDAKSWLQAQEEARARRRGGGPAVLIDTRPEVGGCVRGKHAPVKDASGRAAQPPDCPKCRRERSRCGLRRATSLPSSACLPASPRPCPSPPERPPHDRPALVAPRAQPAAGRGRAALREVRHRSGVVHAVL